MLLPDLLFPPLIVAAEDGNHEHRGHHEQPYSESWAVLHEDQAECEYDPSNDISSEVKHLDVIFVVKLKPVEKGAASPPILLSALLHAVHVLSNVFEQLIVHGNVMFGIVGRFIVNCGFNRLLES